MVDLNSSSEERLVNFSEWKASLLISTLVISSLLIFYGDIFSSLINWWWTTSKYAHSLIIFPAIIYLCYDLRHELKRHTPQTNPLAFIAIIPITILIPLFNYIDVQIIAETLLVILVPMVIWAMMGNAVLLIILTPLSLLITVAPIWEMFASFLTGITADVAHISLNFLGVPVFRDEMYLTIPEGVFEIAEGCGGFRYFISGLSLGLIFAHLNFNSLKRQIIIVLFAVLLSIVTNWIRVMIVIWAGHVTDMQHPYVNEHVNLGWYVFGVAFFLYFFLCVRFIPSGRKERGESDTQASQNSEYKLANYIRFGMLSVFLIVLPQLAITYVPAKHPEDLSAYTFPVLPEWKGPIIGLSNWEPLFPGATHSQVVNYSKEGVDVELFYALYQKQTQGEELINYTNSITNKSWKNYKPKTVIFKGLGQEMLVNRVKVNTTAGERNIWMWYRVAGVDTPERNLAKLLELKQVFNDNKTSMVFAVLSKNEPTEANLKTIARLVNSIYPQLTDNFE